MVICAGGFVRMTGSGMGCPDWPKCFGLWIPPSDISQLPENYKQIYSERGYDKLDFNVFNTWTEYVNRLLGFISGLFCLGMFVISLFIKNRLLVFLSLLLLISIAFQGWLGAVVVYSILAPFKITIHMLMALIILCLVILLFRITSVSYKTKNTGSSNWIFLALLISLIQIVLGTQVREKIDIFLSIYNRTHIIENLPIVFEIHRLVAYLVLFSNAAMIYYYRKLFKIYVELKLIIIILSVLFFSGLLMTYCALIPFAQLIHLICAVSLFMCQWSILLKKLGAPILRIQSSL